MISCGEALRHASVRLRQARIESARLDARVLLGYVLGIDGMTLFVHPERPIAADEMTRFEAILRRRERREPVSHIIGQREFWSLPFHVTANTLDPRPDTETLVETILDAVPERNAPLRLLDFGTGSGCILLALLSELPNAQGLGIDISQAALAVARGNAEALGLAERVEFQEGNWGQGLEGYFDIIVSNPPYIPENDIDGLEPEVSHYEPRTALNGGADGLDCYRILIPDCWRLLADKGRLAFEVGQGQAQAVQTMLIASEFNSIEIRHDLAGIARCVSTQRLQT